MQLDEAPVRLDRKRGCGWRTPGGLYLVAPETGRPCGKLPAPLVPCDSCGHRHVHTKGWTWIEVPYVFDRQECKIPEECESYGCALQRDATFGKYIRMPEDGRAGLIWVGKEHYGTPAEFMAEAVDQGISRRVKTVPREFELGVTWVALAHVQGGACPFCEHPGAEDPPPEECPHCKGTGRYPSVFTMFKPTDVEYVCKGDETPAELDQLLERGVTPVRVQRVDDDGAPIIEDGDATD